jgi:hypothetical protein
MQIVLMAGAGLALASTAMMAFAKPGKGGKSAKAAKAVKAAKRVKAAKPAKRVTAKKTAPAKDVLKDLPMDEETAITLAADRNGFPAGAKVIPTGTYEGYSLKPVVDGRRMRKELTWQEGAWASEGGNVPQALVIHLPDPRKGGSFQVTFCHDCSTWYPARNFRVQVRNQASEPWKDVVVVENNLSTVVSYPWPEFEPYSFIRLYQPANGGAARRPTLMWLGQIELVD